MRKLWFITLLLTALLMGLTFAHTLEMPKKLSVDGPTWLTFQHTLYRYFALVGGPIEVGAVLAATALAIATRRSHPLCRYTAAAAVLLVLSFLGAWVGMVRPVNAKTAAWTAATLPAQWEQARRQWEFGHAAAFALQFAAFSLLLLGLLRTAPPPKPNSASQEISG